MATSKISGADPLWRWNDSLDEWLRTRLAAAAQATWPYAQISAWSYLHDETMAREILEDALDVVRSYALRFSSPPSQEKITARLRSQVRRIAKQKANRTRLVTPTGDLRDLERYASTETPDPTDALLLEQVLTLLSPQAKEVATWIWMGYSWREIGRSFGIDHNTVRLAFRRETSAALIQLGRGMHVGR
ncbi:MAG TPA: hypothetical protein VIX90_08920 [Edaphobacter sp.]